MKHRTLKTMLAAVLILCTLLPLPAANAKTKYTVEVKKTEVEADVVFNTEGYASLTKKYRLSEEERKEAYSNLEYYLEDGETVEEYLERNGFEDIEEYYLDGEFTSSYFADYSALMDKNGKIIMPYIYAANSYYVSDGIIAKGNWYNEYAYPDIETNGYFDLSGNRINETEYIYSRNFSDGIAFVRYEKYDESEDSFYDFGELEACLIDKDENIVLKLPDTFAHSDGVGDSGLGFVGNYDFFGEYSEGLINFSSDFRYKESIFEYYGPWPSENVLLTGYVDLKGDIIIPQKFYDGGVFHSGMAWVQEAILNEEDDSFFASEYTGGKFGYINKTGELVIPYIYDNITDFDGEYASAQKDGKWGLINKKGETIIPFEYDALYIHDGIITSQLNENAPITLMTVNKEIIWQLDAKESDTASTYDDGVLYYIKDSYVHIVTVTAEEEKDGIMGDADGNGKITAADARYSLRASVGLETVTEELIALLDINKDKAVTAADARLILRASVGLEDHTKW